MKTLALLFSFLCLVQAARAQENQPVTSGMPIIVSVFSHAISLPTMRGVLQRPNLGLRLGSEFYYRNRPGSQLIQTLNAGYYYHADFQSGLFLNSEFGYRKFIGSFFAEGFLGIGALGLFHQLPSYEQTESGDFRPASRFLLRAMPSLSVGIGYRFRKRTSLPISVFTRYEIFGETPFSNRGVPVLPHAALHLGARFYFQH